MKLVKTLDIPNIEIKNTHTSTTSNITLSFDGTYVVDFVHSIPNNEFELIDVECVAKRDNYDEAKFIAMSLANFFNIPFKNICDDTLKTNVNKNEFINIEIVSV